MINPKGKRKSSYIQSRDINGNIIYLDPITGKEVSRGVEQGTTLQASYPIKKLLMINLDVQKKHNERIKSGQSVMIRGKEVRITPKQAQVYLSTDGRPLSMKDASKLSYELDYKLLQLDKAVNLTTTALGNFSNYFLPSTYAGALVDKLEGKNSFSGSLIEGNDGLGSVGANLVFDLASPLVLGKGFSLMTTLGKLVRPILNKTVSTIGNYRYPLGRPQIPKNFITIKPQVRTYKKIAQEPSTSLAFFERKPSKISEAERAGVPKLERNFTPKRHIAYYPGYQLKGLMKGSPLEKQLSKAGTINVKLLRAHFNKASQIERDIVNQVLEDKVWGDNIDYNKFKKAVLDELITYDRKPQTKYSDYGMNRIGYDGDIRVPNNFSEYMEIALYKFPNRFLRKSSTEFIDTETGQSVTPFNFHDYDNIVIASLLKDKVTKNTFTFESPRILQGSDKHYDYGTLGHSRTYTTPEEPKILHVMESLSDWAQEGIAKTNEAYRQKLINNPVSYNKRINSLLRMNEELEDWENMMRTGINHAGIKLQPYEVQQIQQEFIPNLQKNILNLKSKLEGNPQALHLSNNYLLRQLQENLKYASEHGQTLMRYPTPETAAKIEGYTAKLQWYSPTGERLDMRNLEYDTEIGDFKYPEGSIMKNEYSPLHQTILKKYSDFPKMFQKLFRGHPVEIVTDSKGNTWYLVNVPKGYLNKEWLFKQGGKMNILQFLKNGSGIRIKKENKGLFTSYCGGKVTSECISKGKHSSNPAIRKRATFAANARKWKHQQGGLILKSLTGTKLTPTEQLVKGWYDGTIGGIVKGIKAFLNLDNVRVGTGGFGGTGDGYGSGGIGGHWKSAYRPKNNLNFNDAFDEAKKAGAETFIFGDKLYNTLSEANPIRERNNRYVGKGRTELIIRKRKGYGKDYGPFQTKLAGEQYAIKYLLGGFMGKVGNFLNSDYGKSIVNLGQLLYSGISDASNKIKQNEKLQKWKQSFIDSQSLSDAERQKFYTQSVLNQIMNNPDSNVSDIVASHDAWKLEQLELQKRKKEAEMLANQYITLMSLIDNNKLTGGSGFNFAGMATDILSGVLGNSSKTQAVTNPSSTYSLFKMPTTNFKVDMKL